MTGPFEEVEADESDDEAGYSWDCDRELGLANGELPEEEAIPFDESCDRDGGEEGFGGQGEET